MNKLTLRCSMLGLFATALSVGCGGADAPDGSSVGATAAAITTVGTPSVSGCNVAQVFDIVAPTNQSIGFVALQAQNLNDLELQLFSVDSNGNQTAMSQSSHAISAAMQQMLQLNQSSSNSLANSASASTQNSSNASTSAQAQNNASNSSNSQSSNNLNENDSTIISHVAHQDASASNSAAVVNSTLLNLLGFFPNPGAANANQNFLNNANSASQSNVSTQDSIQHQQQLQASNQASAANQSANSASNNAATNLANSASQQTANNTAAQAALNLNQNASASNNSSDQLSASSNQAFSNMEDQQLKHVRVLANSIANNQQATTTVTFGANQSVFGNGAFPISLGSCDSGIIDATPVTPDP